MTARKLGRFEIIREIGKGAMGVVYLAHDPKIDRKIAIKMISIPAGVSADEAKESRHRFVREAQAAGKLTHPNIITIYDVVEEDDLSYIAMEYIDGVTLEAYTKPTSLLPLPKVMNIAVQACAALDYAHKNQLIHRDIKPANLMLLKGELLKITDFGLAKSPEANLTQAGVLIGTPNYMSPEQISGKVMDGRSDIFSLGVVLYELLTGERPFGGDTISTIIYRILYEEPRPPRIVNAKLPPSFDAIMKRALAKEPTDRFQSGAEFAEALNNYSTYHLKTPLSTAPPTVRVVRGDADAPSSARERGPARRPAGQPSRNAIFSGQPVKIAAFAFLVLMALLFFPRRVRELENAGQAHPGGATAPPEQSQAGFGGPPLGAPKSFPHFSGHQAQVQAPPAATLFLDNQQLKEPVVKLAEGDQGEHTLVAVEGCREASILIQGAKLEPSIDLKELKPKIGELTVDSKPTDALLYLDGKPRGRTPQRIADYNACEPHTFQVKKENFKEFLRTFDGTGTWSEVAGTLASVSLSEIPSGYAKFDAMPPYPIEVVENNQMVPMKDGVLTLPEGPHNLTLRSPKVFFTRNVKVEIDGSKTRTLKAEWPALGYLTVQAEPSNCKIYVDGELLDYAPVTGYGIVAGEHIIRAVPDPDPGRAQQRKVTIEDGATDLETFTFAF